ncbi:MAG TPA: hypothetical protein VKU19_02890 [Bryobacteraceae bacterium]|nr:hypothetical protein [Bryobacteraceae bacterium]
MRFRTVPRLAVLLVLASLIYAEQDPQSPRLNIVIVEGDGAINNIKQRTTRETIIEVQDENHRPVAGAAVVFLLPNDGPGGAFAGGAKSATITTDSAGRAAMPRLQANQTTGNYQIRVNASSGGRQASVTISQSNVAGAAAAGSAAGAGISAKTIGIIVAVAAAGAVGAAVGLTRNSKSATVTPTAAVPTGSISLGSGASLGPPQ